MGCMGHHGHRKGAPSSFFMHDSKLVFKKLGLKEGDVFLDLGCGKGDYSLAAAEAVGRTGTVYALDIQQEFIENLKSETASRNLANVVTIRHDIRLPIPVLDDSIDVVFISTVLHMFRSTGTGSYENLFDEIRRVLKPGGQLAIIECKKEATPFGPPIEMRVSPEELESELNPMGFGKSGLVDLDRNYLIQFCNQRS